MACLYLLCCWCINTPWISIKPKLLNRGLNASQGTREWYWTEIWYIACDCVNYVIMKSAMIIYRSINVSGLNASILKCHSTLDVRWFGVLSSIACLCVSPHNWWNLNYISFIIRKLVCYGICCVMYYFFLLACPIAIVKTWFCCLCITNAQISLRIHTVWSAPLLFLESIIAQLATGKNSRF